MRRSGRSPRICRNRLIDIFTVDAAGRRPFQRRRREVSARPIFQDLFCSTSTSTATTRPARCVAPDRLDGAGGEIDPASERIRRCRQIAARGRTKRRLARIRSHPVTGFQRRVEALVRGEEGDPFAFLGMHRAADGLTVRAFRPRAETLELVDERSGDAVAHFERLHPEGVFALQLPPGEPFAYRLRERSVHGVRDFRRSVSFCAPARRDRRLAARARPPLAALRGARRARAARSTACAARRLRSGHPTRAGSASSATSTVGTAASIPCAFAASAACGRSSFPARRRRALQIRDRGRARRTAAAHSDPLALASRTAARQRFDRRSAVSSRGTTRRGWRAPSAMRRDGRFRPTRCISARGGARCGDRFLSYDALADQLIPYVSELGFTHIELMPITEHPFDGSWGYQTTGHVRADQPPRHAGRFPRFRRSRARARDRRDPGLGAGALSDRRARPGHLRRDALYEYADPRKGFHHEWGTLIYQLRPARSSRTS